MKKQQLVTDDRIQAIQVLYIEKHVQSRII